VTTSTFRHNETVLRRSGSRLWAGGVATAIVAALIVLVGLCVARGIFAVPVPVPTPTGGLSSLGYIGLAALAAIVATGLLHLLVMAAPRPLGFFTWIVVLATIVAVIAPFMNSVFGSVTHVAMLNSKLATAAINLVVGIAIGSLLTGVARSAVRRRPDALEPYQKYRSGEN
jgi:hypothetical protein